METPSTISKIINKSTRLPEENSIVPFIAPPTVQLRTLYKGGWRGRGGGGLV